MGPTLWDSWFVFFFSFEKVMNFVCNFLLFPYAFSGQRWWACFDCPSEYATINSREKRHYRSFPWSAPQQGGVSNFNHCCRVLIFVVSPTLQHFVYLLLLLPLPLVATCTSNLRARLIVAILRANCGQPQVRSGSCSPILIYIPASLSPPPPSAVWVFNLIFENVFITWPN